MRKERPPHCEISRNLLRFSLSRRFVASRRVRQVYAVEEVYFKTQPQSRNVCSITMGYVKDNARRLHKYSREHMFVPLSLCRNVKFAPQILRRARTGVEIKKNTISGRDTTAETSGKTHSLCRRNERAPCNEKCDENDNAGRDRTDNYDTLRCSVLAIMVPAKRGRVRDLFIANVGDISSATYCNPNSNGIRDAAINVRAAAREFFSRCAVVFCADMQFVTSSCGSKQRQWPAHALLFHALVNLHIFYIAPFCKRAYIVTLHGRV